MANAATLADALSERGFRLVSGGTDVHLMLVDVTPLGLDGRAAANLLEEAGIIVNKNSIPYDPLPPTHPSGIRPGTPAITTRGMKEPEMVVIAELIAQVLRQPQDAAVRSHVRRQVRDLCARFPVYDDLAPEGYV